MRERPWTFLENELFCTGWINLPSPFELDSFARIRCFLGRPRFFFFGGRTSLSPDFFFTCNCGFFLESYSGYSLRNPPLSLWRCIVLQDRIVNSQIVNATCKPMELLRLSYYPPANGTKFQVEFSKVSPILSCGGILVDFYEWSIRVQCLFKDPVLDHESRQELQVRLVVVGLSQPHRLGHPVQDPKGVTVLLDLEMSCSI